MRRSLFIVLLVLAAAASAAAYDVYYKEQYYKLFHLHYAQAPDDTIENIYWLEKAQQASFCNPLYALARIEDRSQWERYRYLLSMHIELKLIEQHLILGSKFDKRRAYFFNAPWKDQNLESLAIAEKAYSSALAYWDEAKRLAKSAMSMPFVKVDEGQHWIDEAYRIEIGELDYAAIIADELGRLRRVRAEFLAMDGNRY